MTTAPRSARNRKNDDAWRRKWNPSLAKNRRCVIESTKTRCGLIRSTASTMRAVVGSRSTSLGEKAAEAIDAEQALRMAELMRKGRFDLEDLSSQLAQVEKLGGMGGIMGMLPGMGKIKEQMANANIDERMIKRQRAIISSMTREERRNPDVLKASRKKRIAAGSGMRVEDVNRLLKQHRQMADMMKALGGAKKGGLGKMAAAFGLGGGNPLAGMPEPTPAELEALQKQFGTGGGLPSAPPSGAFGSSLAGKLPSSLPGLGSGRLPGLGGGFNPFGGKKK